MRILVADMDEELLELLQSFPWDRGHEAEIAADGFECLITLREFRPDVLVLEEKLLWGGADGVLSVLGEDPKLSRIPVVLIGGEATTDEFAAAVIHPVVSCLPRPFRLSDLLEHIESAPGQAGSRASTARLVVKVESGEIAIAYDATDSLPLLPCYAACGEG